MVFSWSKDVGSVQVLRISLNSEPFINNPMLRRKHDIISVIRVLSLSYSLDLPSIVGDGLINFEK